ncbi:MarR family winged helix-turn-helix transcriptional regulator [Microbacterium caowuchunii]|uniref:MarR family transcriptional regulator n=1 Tax=Microbacterium caowuchunii TaxID=2614638 RepID=A0A5N0TPH7_9MICO|nr:MarR family transcriptional regulator [Microbacterium caowuchunii]KAA9136137.1 MarR family transcriptional regulator [Microbacterium caowuchunii]
MDGVEIPDSVLSSLTHLMARWSSAQIQGEIARDADADIDAPDIPALYMLGLEGPLRASELADRLHVSRPTASKQLARLDRAGLVVRTADPGDGRVTIVALSPSGRSRYERLVAQGRVMAATAMSDWAPGTRAQFARRLEAFVGSLGIAPSTSVTDPTDG